MINIPVPLAVSIAVAAVPSIASILVALKMSRKRKPKKEPPQIRLETSPDGAKFGHDMLQQVLDQQIDTIFHSLSALIESECIKLKAVSRSWAMAALDPATRQSEERATASAPIPQTARLTGPRPEQSPDASNRKDDLGEKISACVQKRMTPEEIASQLNLSLVEATLAMRMRGVDQKDRNRIERLEAVA